jgi:tripartite ATP-independent transporter DctP family solute receptor
MTLKIATIDTEKDYATILSRYFAEKVTKTTNGEIEIKVYPAMQLGTARDIMEGVQIGTIGMATLVGQVTVFSPTSGIWGLPFLFKNRAHADEVINSEIGENLKQIMQKEARVKILRFMSQEYRQVLTKEPVRSLNDLQKLKLRMSEDRVLLETFKRLGAATTVIPWADVYTSLKTGVVDGLESTCTSMFAMKFYEGADYLATTNHQLGILSLMINLKIFDKLSNQHKKLIQEIADETGEYMMKFIPTKVGSYVEQLGAEMKEVTYPELEPFQQKVYPMYEEFGKRHNVMELIENINTIGKKY